MLVWYQAKRVNPRVELLRVKGQMSQDTQATSLSLSTLQLLPSAGNSSQATYNLPDTPWLVDLCSSEDLANKNPKMLS